MRFYFVDGFVLCCDFHNKRPLPLRYVLVTVGPVFTEEMWRLACCALQDAFSATLEPVKVRTRGGREGGVTQMEGLT